MFSTILPGVSTNMKFAHNTSSKPSNRYVKSSTNPNVTYLANPNLYDLGYLSILPSEGSPPTWYPNSSYNPPYGQDYAIYSTSASNPFNYDQSAQFLDFEDTSSILTYSTISPATSTDSLETFKSPVDSESLIDELPDENRLVQTSLPIPIPSQVATAGRTLSTHPLSGDHMLSGQFPANIAFRSVTPFLPLPGDMHQMPHALHPPFTNDLTDDTQSTISELEVEERDRIAKMNAEYNAISHVGFLDNSPSQGPMYSADRFREPNPTLQSSSMQARPCLRLSASQPRHPDLHFSQKPIGNEIKDLSPSPYRIYAHPVLIAPRDVSPPSVERVPSQLPPEQNANTNQNLSQLQSSPPTGIRNHEGTPDSDRSRIAQNTSSSPAGFVHSVPQGDHSSNFCVNPQLQTLEPVSAEITRKLKSPVAMTNGQSPQSLADDPETLQQKQQSRPDATSLIQPFTTAKNHFHPYNASPDLRQNAGVIKSSPLAQINKTAESESSERISLGANLRKDTKTPAHSGRGLSYVQSSLDSPSTSSQDVHSSPDMRDKGAHRSSPKSFLNDKSGHLDSGRSPAEVTLSSTPLREHSFSVSVSNWPHEDVIAKRTTRDADSDREFERNRHLRSSGTERTAISKFTDENSRGTPPSMHSQGPLHKSPEVALGAFHPDPQIAPVVTVSDSRPMDLHHSKTVQASMPNSLDSRESRKARESHVNFSKTQSETTKREGNDVRMPSNVILSSPVNKIVTTCGSTSSKAILDFPPVTILPEPHRRHSDGDQVGPPIRPSLLGRNSAPLVRSVRWTEGLIAPSPILAPPRRKGWFNRRGEQLWTNNGDYRPPRSGDEYPLDLNDYPEPGDGWMNEDGIRIDMTHCRIPKALPRPALKKA